MIGSLVREDNWARRGGSTRRVFNTPPMLFAVCRGGAKEINADLLPFAEAAQTRVIVSGIYVLGIGERVVSLDANAPGASLWLIRDRIRSDRTIQRKTSLLI